MCTDHRQLYIKHETLLQSAEALQNMLQLFDVDMQDKARIISRNIS